MFAVVNHLHFNKPVDEFREVVEREGMPLLATYPGFMGFYFVKEADDKGIIIILWQDGPSAAEGAKSFGPTWFAKNFAPYLASEQQRAAGEVLVRYQG